MHTSPLPPSSRKVTQPPRHTATAAHVVVDGTAVVTLDWIATLVGNRCFRAVADQFARGFQVATGVDLQRE